MEDPDESHRRRSLKRSFDQISRSPPPQPIQQHRPDLRPPVWTTNFANAVRNSSTRFAASNGESTFPAPHRFIGDGIDTRRPIMSATTPVIDLTGPDSPEQSRSPQALPSMRLFPGRFPPQLNREPSIIDLENLPSEPSPQRTTPPVDLTGPTPVDLEEGEDDDVMFISENPRPQPLRISQAMRMAHPNRPSNPGPPGLPRLFHRFVNTGYDGTQAQPQPNTSDRRGRYSRWERIERDFQHHEQVMGSMRPERPRIRVPNPPRGEHPYGPVLAFGRFPHSFASVFSWQNFFGNPATGPLPTNLDYENIPFDPATAMPTRPSRPTYEAPPPVPEGFTRSPREGDVLVCPNCDHELATGEGLDKQVWIVRECGHVYCGFCASTRPSGKQKPKNKPPKKDRPRNQEYLSQCEVEGCKSKTNKKTTMFQIWVNTD